jgi:hypothetical protein
MKVRLLNILQLATNDLEVLGIRKHGHDCWGGNDSGRKQAWAFVEQSFLDGFHDRSLTNILRMTSIGFGTNTTREIVHLR